jgi:hypothetical protein
MNAHVYVYVYVYLLYINIIKFEIYIRLNQPFINTAVVFASVMSADPVPPPCEILALLQSLIKTTSPKDPSCERLVSALKDVSAYYDDIVLIREEGGRNFDPDTHKRVIAQEQEKWEDYYKEDIVSLIPVEVLASFSQEVVRSSNKEED